MLNREFRALRRDPYAMRATRGAGVSPSIEPSQGIVTRIFVDCLLRLPRILAFTVVGACFVELVLRIV